MKNIVRTIVISIFLGFLPSKKEVHAHFGTSLFDGAGGDSGQAVLVEMPDCTIALTPDGIGPVVSPISTWIRQNRPNLPTILNTLSDRGGGVGLVSYLQTEPAWSQLTDLERDLVLQAKASVGFNFGFAGLCRQQGWIILSSDGSVVLEPDIEKPGAIKIIPTKEQPTENEIRFVPNIDPYLISASDYANRIVYVRDKQRAPSIPAYSLVAVDPKTENNTAHLDLTGEAPPLQLEVDSSGTYVALLSSSGDLSFFEVNTSARSIREFSRFVARKTAAHEISYAAITSQVAMGDDSQSLFPDPKTVRFRHSQLGTKLGIGWKSKQKQRNVALVWNHIQKQFRVLNLAKVARAEGATLRTFAFSKDENIVYVALNLPRSGMILAFNTQTGSLLGQFNTTHPILDMSIARHDDTFLITSHDRPFDDQQRTVPFVEPETRTPLSIAVWAINRSKDLSTITAKLVFDRFVSHTYSQRSDPLGDPTGWAFWDTYLLRVLPDGTVVQLALFDNPEHRVRGVILGPNLAFEPHR